MNKKLFNFIVFQCNICIFAIMKLFDDTTPDVYLPAKVIRNILEMAKEKPKPLPKYIHTFSINEHIKQYNEHTKRRHSND
jgi:hypothetical protein